MDLAIAKAVVSGGASGLGYATAKHIIAAGGHATLLDVNVEQGEKSAAELGERAHFIRTDVSDQEQVRAAVTQGASLMGGLSIAINCAGIVAPGRVLGRSGPMESDYFSKTIMINLVGSFNVGKEAANVMQNNKPNGEGERGVIINTSSVAAYEGQIGQAGYSASKGGIVGMTVPAARDLAGRGIRVVSIAPGLFDTPLLAALPEEARAELGAQTPFPARLGAPEEFAQLVSQIVENPMLNGTTIRLDGALRMAPR